MSKSHPYLITVLTGPNSGAQVPCTGKRISLGGDPSNDLQLDDYAGPNLTISMKADRVRVAADADGASVGTRQALGAGKARIDMMPMTVTADDATQIHICRAVAARPSKWPRVRLAALTVALLGGGIAFATTGGIVYPGRDAPAPDATAAAFVSQPAPTTQATEPDLIEVAAPVVARLTVDDAAISLRSMVADAGLIGVDVTADGGLLRVSGAIDPESRAAWQQVRHAYDDRWNAVADLLVSITYERVEPPFSVQNVWLMEPLEITTRTGDKLYIGDEVDGWTVTSIGAHEVHLMRDDQPLIIEY